MRGKDYGLLQESSEGTEYMNSHNNRITGMRHLVIKNFGPIARADLNLGRVNVLIGMQSSGKSCVLKTACYCTWVEKRLELTQKANGFGEGSAFIDIMTDYYQMAGYVHEDTYIEYETNHLFFSYDHSSSKFSMKWNPDGRWSYRRPKVSYVPADRNLVAAIPGWSSLSLDGNMIEFMSDWDKARKSVKTEGDVLGLGMSYSYDSRTNADTIRLKDGTRLKLKESSSGIQSLLPMYVHLDYLTHGQYYDKGGKLSYEQKEERRNFLSILYAQSHEKNVNHGENVETITLEGSDYSFSEPKEAKKIAGIYHNYMNVGHSEIFLEEPEDNLFPPTQCQFVNWLLEKMNRPDDRLFIATHSPYVLNQLIKVSPRGLSVMFTHSEDAGNGGFTVRQLSPEEFQEVYDNGVDIFFNFELYV